MQIVKTQVLIIGGGVTGAGLARDLALRGVNCVIVEKHDIAALAEKINLLLESTVLYESFSKAARKQILEVANIDKMCDGFVNTVQYLEQQSN